MQSSRTHHLTRRLAALALLSLATLALLGVAAQPAAAYDSYQHGGTTCSSCHASLTNAGCTQSGCHNDAGTAFQAPAGQSCWGCHEPDEDMSAVQSDPGCGAGAAGAACHGTSAGHVGSDLRGCTTCHGSVVAFNDAGTSAHHSTAAFDAPTCTDCHKTGGSAAAPHPAYTAEACGVCHTGMTTTHPAAAAMPTPTLTVTAEPAAVTVAGGTTAISGTLKNGATALTGATLLLQKAATGTAAFTQVGGTVTTGLDGGYAFPATAPNGATTYRVVARGMTIGQTVTRPVKGTVDVTAPATAVKPAVTIALSKTSILVNRKVTIKGKVTPVKSGAVKVAIQKKTASGSWKPVTSKTVTLTAGATASSYTWSYKATKRGVYRARTTSPAATGFLKATSVYKTFRAK